MVTRYDKVIGSIGRLLFGGLLLYSGIQKIISFAVTANWITSAGLPFSKFLLVVAIIIEIGVGLSFLFRYETKQSSILLAVYLIIVSFVFHNPFNPAQLVDFSKNMMIVGLLLVIGSIRVRRVKVHRE